MAYGRTYSLPIEHSDAGIGSLTTAPFLQISTPSTMAIEILSIMLGQEASETSEQLCLLLSERAVSTLPNAKTPIPDLPSQGASLLTGSTTTNANGIASATGSLTQIKVPMPFNALNGLLYMPPERETLIMPPSKFWVLEFKNAPAAGIWWGRVKYRELF